MRRHRSRSRDYALLAPLFLVFVWMAFLILDIKSASPEVQLAPAAVSTLITVLFVFIVLYAAVMAYVLRRRHTHK